VKDTQNIKAAYRYP